MILLAFVVIVVVIGILYAVLTADDGTVTRSTTSSPACRKGG